MRRRLVGTPRSNHMEKGQGKNSQSRLYLLAALSFFFWLFLLYIHFVVIGGRNVNLLERFNSVSFDTESSFSEIIDPPSVPVTRPVISNRPLKIDDQSGGGVLSDAQPPPPPPPIGDSDSRSTKGKSKTPEVDDRSGDVSRSSQLSPPIGNQDSSSTKGKSKTPKVDDHGRDVSRISQQPPPISDSDSRSTKGKSETPKVDDHGRNVSRISQQSPPIGDSDSSSTEGKSKTPEVDDHGRNVSRISEQSPPIGDSDSRGTKGKSKTPKVDDHGRNVSRISQHSPPIGDSDSRSTKGKSKTPKVDDHGRDVSRISQQSPPIGDSDSRSTKGKSKTPKVDDHGGDVLRDSQPSPPIGNQDSRNTKGKIKTPTVDDHSGDVSNNVKPSSPIGNEDSSTTKGKSRSPKVNDQSGDGSSNVKPSPPNDHQDSRKAKGKSKSPEGEVEKYPFMKALRSIDNKSDPCGGRYIFVHDIPSRFKEDMLKDCKTISVWTNMCKFITNDGLGPPLENAEGVFSDTGWYATNQFAVDVIFSNRMKQYECLTNDSSLAAAFFVPFFAGFDISRYLWGGFNASMRDAASLDLVDWLGKREEWGIMGGKDHFLVAGRITWDFRRLSDDDSDWGNKLMLLPAARNMSILVVESSPWNANDYAIPYPTYFHPEKDADVFVWQDRMRKLDRKWLFCFAGAPRPGDPRSIRGQIIDECKKSKVCKLLECDLGESKCHSPGSIMKMFQSSRFCLQPQGDSYTRRSAFDSILGGCIPVFFHPGSAYTQYTWHLPKSYSNYSVLIPEKDIRKKKVTIEQILSRISPDKVKQMTKEVINLIPRIIYADPRSKLETVKDAFDISVKGVIDKVTKLRRNIVAGRVENIIEELSWKYALSAEEPNLGPHEWDLFFSKHKDGTGDSDASSSAEAAKNSWKNEQRQHS